MPNEPTVDAEIRRALATANNLARLMNAKVAAVEWKLRAFGASDGLVRELCNG